jgi:hypothetical protein
MLPSLQKARELTRRTMCLSNLNCIGKAMGLYLTAYDGKYPYIDHPLADMGLKRRTGTRREVEPGPTPVPRSISSVIFFYVREGNDPKLFLCPSDPDVNPKGDPSTREPNTGKYYWDFTGYQYVSYSIQAVAHPMGAGEIKFTNAKQFYMADKNPNWDGLHAPTVGWRDTPPMTPADMKALMPPNHQGEMFNTVKGDGQAAPIKGRSDVGELVVSGGVAKAKDNIFTTYVNNGNNCQSSITTIPWVTWQDANDAFLFGPIVIE